jgi:hypothetical protein
MVAKLEQPDQAGIPEIALAAISLQETEFDDESL